MNTTVPSLKRVPLKSPVYQAHQHLFDEFLKWLDGGEPSDTRIEDNIKSFVLVIAAMETTLDGQPKQIADYLSDLEL